MSPTVTPRIEVMSSYFLPPRRSGRNRIAPVRQRELYIIGIGRALNRQNQNLREAITQALVDGAQVQPGSISADVVLTPREWTMRSIEKHLSATEKAAVLRHAPVEEYFMLRIDGKVDLKPTKLKVADVLSGGMVPQRVLQRYLDQIPLCREVQDRRNTVVDRLSHGVSIEDGDFDTELATRMSPSYSREVFVSALGQIRCSEIELAIEPLTRRRLVLRDSEGRPLGWHAGNADLRLATGNYLNCT